MSLTRIAASQEAAFLCYTFTMSIVKDIEIQVVQAMKAKDAPRLSALRNLKAAFMTEVIALKTKELTDEQAFTVIKRLVKQRKDSAEQFKKGGRAELAEAEEAESKILEAFLPAQMPEAEVRKIAEAVKAKLGVTDLPAPSQEARQAGKSKLGQLIGAVMKETRGRADGGLVKKVVESLFA